MNCLWTSHYTRKANPHLLKPIFIEFSVTGIQIQILTDDTWQLNCKWKFIQSLQEKFPRHKYHLRMWDLSVIKKVSVSHKLKPSPIGLWAKTVLDLSSLFQTQKKEKSLICGDSVVFRLERSPPLLHLMKKEEGWESSRGHMDELLRVLCDPSLWLKDAEEQIWDRQILFYTGTAGHWVLKQVS